MTRAPIRSARASWRTIAVLVVGALVVAAVHFRPWEVAFLEEWPLAADWADQDGGAFASSYLEWTLSRPLHLIPSLVGLWLGGGHPIGIFVVLALVAAAQFLLTVWALRPVSRSFLLSVAAALFVALHPLWPGGLLQRFLPAQTAVLALVIATGLVIRWITGGRASRLVWACVVVLLGLMVYPGPAAAAPLMGLVVALALRAPWRRLVVTVAALTLTSGLMTLYSLVISRLISPDGTSYETGNIAVAGVQSLRQLVTLVVATLTSAGLPVLAGVAAIAVLGAVLALTGAVPNRDGWLLTGTALISPLSTVVYFGHIGWLNDIDRLGYVISIALALAVLVWPLTATGTAVRMQQVIAVALVAVSLAGAVVGIRHWQPAIAAQHRLLDALGPIVRDADDEDEYVVVIDRSGTFGLQSTFPLQYLASASRVWNDDPTLVRLCFDDPAAVPSGGEECDPDETGPDLVQVGAVPFGAGTVDIYLGQQEK